VAQGTKIHYTTAPDGVHLAYQVMGEGSLDLMLLPAEFISIDMTADEAHYAKALESLAAFARVIRFDRRGVGLSDPVPSVEVGAIDRWVDDAVVVLDAVGSERPAVMGTNEGGLPAMLFAAMHPVRTKALVLFETYARLCVADDYPFGWTTADVERLVGDATAADGARDAEGSEFDLLATIAPSVASDPRFQAWWKRAGHHGASPATAKALWFAYAMADLRGVLPIIQPPTLVLHRSADAALSPEFGRYVADHIPDTRYLELAGSDNLWWLDPAGALVGEVEEFLTGVRHAPETDRVLATVMFTDIVGSTQRAAELGDQTWCQVLDSHDQAVRRQLDRFRGREVHTAGDGFLATFDGPGRAIQCACAIRDAVGGLGIEVRVGLHTGEIEVRGDDVAGMAVHIGARVSSLADAGEVLVSSTVKDLVVGSAIEFADRGEHELKGVPGRWKLYAVEG
jgi:class 3 adenylate cyclase